MPWFIAGVITTLTVQNLIIRPLGLWAKAEQSKRNQESGQLN